MADSATVERSGVPGSASVTATPLNAADAANVWEAWLELRHEGGLGTADAA